MPSGICRTHLKEVGDFLEREVGETHHCESLRVQEEPDCSALSSGTVVEGCVYVESVIDFSEVCYFPWVLGWPRRPRLFRDCRLYKRSEILVKAVLSSDL